MISVLSGKSYAVTGMCGITLRNLSLILQPASTLVVNFHSLLQFGLEQEFLKCQAGPLLCCLSPAYGVTVKH